MARYTGPTTRINRRFGMAIFPPNKAFERRPYFPGAHGQRLRRKSSDYSIGLNEKQKLRYLYGLTEKQFRLTFARAKKERGITRDRFLQLLESRLDNVTCWVFQRRANRPDSSLTMGTSRLTGKKLIYPVTESKLGKQLK